MNLFFSSLQQQKIEEKKLKPVTMAHIYYFIIFINFNYLTNFSRNYLNIRKRSVALKISNSDIINGTQQCCSVKNFRKIIRN